MLTHEFCGHPAGCDVPSWRCEIDHIQPFADEGPTAVTNADPKCTPHNRYKETLDHRKRTQRRADQKRRASRGDGDGETDRDVA